MDSFFSFFNNHIQTLNQSKFFAGMVMIMLNIGSKYITVKLSPSQEAYLRNFIARELIIFAVAWMGTRDIYTSLILTAVFTVLSDHLFNEESPYCIVPKNIRVLTNIVDINNDEKISEEEINNAIYILEKAKRENEVTYLLVFHYSLTATYFFSIKG